MGRTTGQMTWRHPRQQKLALSAMPEQIAGQWGVDAKLDREQRPHLLHQLCDVRLGNNAVNVELVARQGIAKVAIFRK